MAEPEILAPIIGSDLVPAFELFQETTLDDGRGIIVFQHLGTRRLIYLFDDLSLLGYTVDGEMCSLEPGQTLRSVIEGWSDDPPEPEDRFEYPRSLVRILDAVLAAK